VLIMNNQCVQHLTDESLLEGLYTLQRAVGTLRDAVTPPASTNRAAGADESSLPQSSLEMPTKVIPSCDFEKVWIQRQFGFQFRHNALSDSTTDFENSTICDRPLLLYLSETPFATGKDQANSLAMVHPNVRSGDGDEDSNFTVITLFSAVILFNLALVCHRWGMIYGRDTFLIRTSHLYMVIHGLLSDQVSSSLRCMDDTNGTNKRSDSVLLLSLVINNLGQIQYELCNYPGYDQCMTMLNNLAWNHSGGYNVHGNPLDFGTSSVDSNSSRHVENDTSTTQSWDGIHTNLLFWQWTSPSVAHAA
jgi:hypothetical protein